MKGAAALLAASRDLYAPAGADLLCDPVSGCALAENRICTVDLGGSLTSLRIALRCAAMVAVAASARMLADSNPWPDQLWQSDHVCHAASGAATTMQ